MPNLSIFCDDFDNSVYISSYKKCTSFILSVFYSIVSKLNTKKKEEKNKIKIIDSNCKILNEFS